jgi:hypothetical protein
MVVNASDILQAQFDVIEAVTNGRAAVDAAIDCSPISWYWTSCFPNETGSARLRNCGGGGQTRKWFS